jgi:ATP-dependent Clp protease ATP-binding subunit ClpA
MGVTKQAAQKRFVGRSSAPSALDASQGFSRFTADARSVVVDAQEQARAAGNDTVGIPHLLLAMLGSSEGTVARALAAQGADLDVVRRTASATVPPAAAEVPALIPFDAHARAALERTFEEATRLGADSVGPEHLLLAVLAVEDGTGVLAGSGVTAEGVEAFLAGG